MNQEEVLHGQGKKNKQNRKINLVNLEHADYKGPLIQPVN